MKFYVCFTLCFLWTFVQAMSVEEKTKLFVDTINSCGEEIGASKEDIMAVTEKQMELSDSAKCVLACTMKKIGIVGPDGKLSMDGSKQMAAKMHPDDDSVLNTVEEITNKCMTAADPGDAECEAIFKYMSCYKDEMVARGMPPP